MPRQRVSTTVDRELLGVARGLRPWKNDASLLDAALQALVARHRAAEIDATYRAYDEHPLDEADEWAISIHGTGPCARDETDPRARRGLVERAARDRAPPGGDPLARQRVSRRRMAIVGPCTTTIRNLSSEVILEPGDDPFRAVRRSTWTRSRTWPSAYWSSGSDA